TTPGTAFSVMRCFQGYVRQRYEFSKATGATLQVTNGAEMRRPMTRMINVAKHDGGRGAEAGAMCSLHYFQPLRRVQLVGTQLSAHFIVQHFRCSARQGVESSRL